MQEKPRIDELLQQSFVDFRLDAEERNALRELLYALDDDAVRYTRNAAFSMARDVVKGEAEESVRAVSWLERVIKSVDERLSSRAVEEVAHFSPGESCRRAIVNLLQTARQRVDICVFTISDNEISAEIVAAYRRGVPVRIITDNDKAHDMGSDVHEMVAEGVSVRIDRTPNHMHHKYAIIDNSLINGSFNWTRSATERNQENIVVSDSRLMIAEFEACFESLWRRFAP